MDRSWMLKDRRSKDYENGVEHFLNTALIYASDLQSIRCPCRLCGNLKCQSVEEIRNHLFFNGIDQSYLTWIWHGESATDRASPFINEKDDSDQKVHTVGEALGYQVAWPKKLIVINYEVASKDRGVVGDEAKLYQHIYEKVIKIAYEKELFSEEVDFHLQKVDMEYICELKEVSLTCIVVYMSYLYDVMKTPNMHGSFIFVNPYITSARKKPSDNANATLLARRLEDAKPGELVVAPCNIGFHWSLLVIDASTSTVYYLDSVLDEVPMDVKILIRCAIIIYEGNKGNKMKSLVWQVVQCPKQPATVECGFYVMMFMRELIKDKSILSKNNNFHGRKTYTKAEIDEVRVEWINFVMTKYEQHLF